MLLTQETSKHNNLFGLPMGLSLQEAVPFLDHLAREPAFLNLQIPPLIEQAEGEESWYVADRYEAPDGSYSLQVFVWPPGSSTRIHDHSS